MGIYGERGVGYSDTAEKVDNKSARAMEAAIAKEVFSHLTKLWPRMENEVGHQYFARVRSLVDNIVPIIMIDTVLNASFSCSIEEAKAMSRAIPDILMEDCIGIKITSKRLKHAIEMFQNNPDEHAFNVIYRYKDANGISKYKVGQLS